MFLDIRTEKLKDFCPPGTLPLVDTWLSNRKFHLKLSRDRMTKLGDFRPPSLQSRAKISVNKGLHPVEFLITLAHEVAHYDVFTAYKVRKKPHGQEWKKRFRELLKEIIDSGQLDDRICDAIIRCYFLRDRISSSSCVLLKDILEEGIERKANRLSDISEGEAFHLRNGKSFIKGPKLRTRYRCKEIVTGRIFTIHPLAEIIKKDS